MSERLVAELERLYRGFAPLCLGYARILLGSGASADEDIVHDVFVRLLRRPAWSADPPPDEQVRGYLLAAVRNAAANVRRDQARHRRHLEQVARTGPMFSPPADNRVDVDLGELLARLPDEQREAVYLKVWGGQTFARIAELTGVPLQTAASRFRYGLAKLRELMEPKQDD